MKYISVNAVSSLAQDVQYLTKFVNSLENAEMLKENLDELQQTVNLMQSENHEEFYDMSVRNKKYNRVDALNGPILLEKYEQCCYHIVIVRLTVCRLASSAAQASVRSAPLSNLSSRFGMMK